jgi:hypothetical protein
MDRRIFCVLAALVAGLFCGTGFAEDEPQSTEPTANCLQACSGGQCGDQCGGRGWVAGVEATFLRPNIRNEVITFENAYSTFTSTRSADFNEMIGAPRIWLGVENDCGWGTRVRFWTFNGSSHGVDLFGRDPNFNDAQLASACETLRAYTIDWEITKRGCIGNWELLPSFGVRYAYREIGESFLLNSRAEDLSSFTSLSDRAGGTGITLGLEAARPIGDCGLALCGSIRGSFLWGDASNQYLGQMSTDTANVLQGFASGTNTNLNIFELQLGFRWSRRIECVCSEVFTTLMFEYQLWDNNGCANPAFVQGIDTNLVYGQTLSQRVEFAGIAWAIGIKR